MPVRKMRRALTFAALMALGALSTPPSQAAEPGMIEVGVPAPVSFPGDEGTTGPTGSATPAPDEGMCGAFDPDCRRRIFRVLGGIHFAEMEIEGGVRFGNGPLDGAVRFAVTGVSAETPVGGIDVAMFEAIYLPQQGGMRIRLTVADSDVLFFCKDQDGGTVAPGMALFAQCEPTGMWGVGGTVLEGQIDTNTGRWAARWLELHGVLNVLRNGNGFDFLKRQLLVHLGASVDTVSPGSTPGAGTSAETMPRVNVGISGMIRSDNNRWEIRGYAGYRPNVIAWDDYALEARAQVLYHLLLSRGVMATIGLDAHYTHWSVPWHSIGPFASDRERDSFFVGLMFGIVF